MNIESYILLLAVVIAILFIMWRLRKKKIISNKIKFLIIGVLAISLGMFALRMFNINIPYISGQIQTNIPSSPPSPKKPIAPVIDIPRPDVYGDAKKELDLDIESYIGANKK